MRRIFKAMQSPTSGELLLGMRGHLQALTTGAALALVTHIFCCSSLMGSSPAVQHDGMQVSGR